MTLITLAPRLPPNIDGVGDYAFMLASQIYKDYGISTRFIAGDPEWHRSSEGSDFAAQAVSHRSADSLLALLQSASTVILHYVPHGYAHKACPFWLIKGLEHWRASNPVAKVITMFHELYALDWHRPWSSDFYLSPIQQHLAARIAQLSDVCLTSTERYTQTIKRLSRGRHHQIPVLPVFSNMGEPSRILPLDQRQRRLAIFGQRHSKRLIYQKSHTQLATVCRALAIQEICDIGPETGLTPRQIGSIPIIEMGKLPENQISQILSTSLAGFLNYDPKRLGKSGIFAAYCAHGLLPINHRSLSYSLDGIKAGQHYWCPQPKSANLPDIDAIAHNALAWYRCHTLSEQARIFYSHLPSKVVSSIANGR